MEPGADEETPVRLRRMPSRLLSLASTHAQRLVGEELAGADSRKYHYALLAALEEFGPASQAALSSRTGIYRSDLVATINELAARRFIDRVPNPDDRRRNIVTLTDDGRRHLARLDALLGAVQDELLAPLAPAEREELVRLLTLLLGRRAQPDS